MIQNIYLGAPPDKIKKWIIANKKTDDYVDTSFVGQIVKALESCKPDQFSDLEYLGDNEILKNLKIGSSIVSKYENMSGKEPIDMEWIVLGYNASIPEYIKYMNGDERIYIRSATGENGEMTADFISQTAYKRFKFEGLTEGWRYTEVGQVTHVSEEIFTYGNNNPYSVPMSVTVNGTEYSFAGNCITLNSKLMLNVDGYNCMPFSTTNFSNWTKCPTISQLSGANIRRWMNGHENVQSDSIYTPNHGKSADISKLKPLTQRFDSDLGFSRNLMPVVDRVGLSRVYHSAYGRTNTIAIDTFSLLGIGNICQSDYYKQNFYDCEYDTSTFSKSFDITNRTDPLKIRKCMNSDGSEGEEYGYFLRSDTRPDNDDDSYSAQNDDAYMHVSFVETTGVADSGIPQIFSSTWQPFDFTVPNFGGMLPVCIIG